MFYLISSYFIYLGLYLFPFLILIFSLSRFTTDCCVIGNVSTLGVGLWGFKSLQSDWFFIFFIFIYIKKNLTKVFYHLLFLYIFMPQLVPFYFLNLLTFGILAIALLLFFISTLILPNILRLLIARILIVKL